MNTVQHEMLDLVGREYKKIMECKKRYLVVKGSRASKKSKNIALRWILMLYEFPLSNLLVIRKYSTLLKQSCRADLIWAIKRLGVERDWTIPRGELTLTRTSTGQMILFRGAAEPETIASITVSTGYLNFAWLEEAYQIDQESDFNMIDEAIRGQLPEGYFKQIVLTFNPWHESSWLRERFYVMQPGEIHDDELQYEENTQKSTQSVLAVTRNYTCNEWLDKADLENFNRMKVQQPARYQVAGLGKWGITGNVIYTNFYVHTFNWKAMFYMKDENGKPIYEKRIGLDFGFTHHTAGVEMLVDRAKREIYICQELYKARLSTDEIYRELRQRNWHLEEIHADSEDPRTIQLLRKLGCPRIFGVKKGPGSVMSGIQELQGYTIIIHPSCENFQIEIAHYAFKQDAYGKELPQPVAEWDHLMDAMRYAMIDDTAGLSFVDTSIKPPKDEVERYRQRLSRLRTGLV